MKQTIRKYLLILAGSLCIALGFLGVILPLMPTTPFLLLAAYCYLRSSTRLYNWLLQHRIFGNYLSNYLNHKAIPHSTRIIALICLWSALSVSFILHAHLPVRLMLLAVGLGVTIHLCSLKTLPKDMSVEECGKRSAG